MIIRDLGLIANSDARVISATVSWEDCDHPDQELFFETSDGDPDYLADELRADPFLAACFPLAVAHGEVPVHIGYEAFVISHARHLADRAAQCRFFFARGHGIVLLNKIDRRNHRSPPPARGESSEKCSVAL